MKQLDRIIAGLKPPLLLASVFSLIIIGLGLAHTSQTQAATNAPVLVRGISIAPLRSEPNIAPGTVYSGEVTVYNSTTESLEIKMTAEEFGVTDEQYDYSFDPGSRLIDWVRFDQNDLILQPGKSQQVTFTISVPIGAEPRGQYISIFASSKAETSSTGISSQERVASLLYITVTGKVSRLGGLVSLRSPWYLTGSDQWTAEVKNTGTTHFRSVYSVTTETLIGGKLGSLGGNSLILPDTIRLVQGDIPSPLFPGIYKLIFNVGLGDTPAKTITRYVIYLRPIDLVVIITLIVVVVLSIFVKRKKQKRLKGKDQIKGEFK